MNSFMGLHRFVYLPGLSVLLVLWVLIGWSQYWAWWRILYGTLRQGRYASYWAPMNVPYECPQATCFSRWASLGFLSASENGTLNTDHNFIFQCWNAILFTVANQIMRLPGYQSLSVFCTFTLFFHFNLLFTWGGGIYYKELFHEIESSTSW